MKVKCKKAKGKTGKVNTVLTFFKRYTVKITLITILIAIGVPIYYPPLLLIPYFRVLIYKRLLCGEPVMVSLPNQAGEKSDIMENFEQRWIDTEFLLQERFGKVPDMEGILFLIGVNELGRMPRKKFSKEQKQDLMHIAVCTLLCQLDYYEYVGRDADGWPHFNELAHVTTTNMQEQERMLKECVIRYFE